MLKCGQNTKIFHSDRAGVAEKQNYLELQIGGKLITSGRGVYIYSGKGEY